MDEGLRPLVHSLATHRAPLDEAPTRFPLWIRPDTGVIKALLEI
jgi:hypothetical protein